MNYQNIPKPYFWRINVKNILILFFNFLNKVSYCKLFKINLFPLSVKEHLEVENYMQYWLAQY